MKTHYFARAIKSILSILVFPASILISTAVLYFLEGMLFEALGYRWSGPYDLFFNVLIILEIGIGIGVGLLLIPRRLGITIYNYLDLDTKRFLWNILLIGLSLGVSFLGLLKFIVVVGLIALQ
jgi:hypothetical protein